MKLHQIHGKNRYCGPAAISAITGASTDDAAYAIRCRSGQRFVKGSEDRHVLEALLESGVFAERAYSAPTGKGLTFANGVGTAKKIARLVWSFSSSLATIIR